MNSADITGLGIIILFVALGYFMGSVRSLTAMLGIIAAFKVADQLYAGGAAKNTYVFAFLGITILGAVVGALFYGRTRTTFIESMEGVFGAVFGLVVGWGIARFIFSVTMFYNLQTPFAHAIASGAFSMDIYTVSPLKFILESTTTLRNPNPFG